MAGDASRQNGKKGGRPKGSINKATIEKEALRQLYLERQSSRVLEVADAQHAAAVGVSHMMAKDTQTGQWIEVTDPAMMVKCLNAGETFYKISAVNPNVQAQNSFLDRVLDKPAEQVKVTGSDDGPVEHIFRWRK